MAAENTNITTTTDSDNKLCDLQENGPNIQPDDVSDVTTLQQPAECDNNSNTNIESAEKVVIETSNNSQSKNITESTDISNLSTNVVQPNIENKSDIINDTCKNDEKLKDHNSVFTTKPPAATPATDKC